MDIGKSSINNLLKSHATSLKRDPGKAGEVIAIKAIRNILRFPGNEKVPVDKRTVKRFEMLLKNADSMNSFSDLINKILNDENKLGDIVQAIKVSPNGKKGQDLDLATLTSYVSDVLNELNNDDITLHANLINSIKIHDSDKIQEDLLTSLASNQKEGDSASDNLRTPSSANAEKTSVPNPHTRVSRDNEPRRAAETKRETVVAASPEKTKLKPSTSKDTQLNQVDKKIAAKASNTQTGEISPYEFKKAISNLSEKIKNNKYDVTYKDIQNVVTLHQKLNALNKTEQKPYSTPKESNSDFRNSLEALKNFGITAHQSYPGDITPPTLFSKDPEAFMLSKKLDFISSLDFNTDIVRGDSQFVIKQTDKTKNTQEVKENEKNKLYLENQIRKIAETSPKSVKTLIKSLDSEIKKLEGVDTRNSDESGNIQSQITVARNRIKSLKSITDSVFRT